MTDLTEKGLEDAIQEIKKLERERGEVLNIQPKKAFGFVLPDTYLLGELLAVIHGDGGQHQDTVGTEQAVKDAMDKFHAINQRIEQLQDLAGTCYAGLGGECSLPENWLDALHAAAESLPFSTEGLLPFTYKAPSDR